METILRLYENKFQALQGQYAKLISDPKELQKNLELWFAQHPLSGAVSRIAHGKLIECLQYYLIPFLFWEDIKNIRQVSRLWHQLALECKKQRSYWLTGPSPVFDPESAAADSSDLSSVCEVYPKYQYLNMNEFLRRKWFDLNEDDDFILPASVGAKYWLVSIYPKDDDGDGDNFLYLPRYDQRAGAAQPSVLPEGLWLRCDSQFPDLYACSLTCAKWLASLNPNLGILVLQDFGWHSVFLKVKVWPRIHTLVLFTDIYPDTDPDPKTDILSTIRRISSLQRLLLRPNFFPDSVEKQLVSDFQYLHKKELRIEHLDQGSTVRWMKLIGASPSWPTLERNKEREADKGEHQRKRKNNRR